MRDFDSRLALLLATVLDIEAYQVELMPDEKKVISLLGAKKLVMSFENCNTRVFSDELKMYILGTFVDQGLINLSKIYEKEDLEIIEIL